MKKIYKTIKEGDHETNIYGSNRWIKIKYARPEWSEEAPPYFVYQGRRIYSDEFMCIDIHAPQWIKEFHGYTNDSFFSGLLIKLDEEGERAKVFTFIS